MIVTSPDGQWVAFRRGREVALLAGGAGAPVGMFVLDGDDADLALVGPPSALVVVQRDTAPRAVLHQPPYLEAVARIDMDVPMRLAASTGPRIALVSLDGKKLAFVRAAGRSLSAQPIDVAGPVEFAVGLERNQMLVGMQRKLEVWDTVASRPLLRLQLQLPPPPRTLGAAHGHIWCARPGSDEVFVFRLSDGRPFRHYIGAPVESVVCHPASPLIVAVTARGLVRLHCFAHSLAQIDAPWTPGTSLAQLAIGEEITLLGMSEGDSELWRVPIGGPGAALAIDAGAAPPAFAPPPPAPPPAAADADASRTTEARPGGLASRSDTEARPGGLASHTEARPGGFASHTEARPGGFASRSDTEARPGGFASPTEARPGGFASRSDTEARPGGLARGPGPGPLRHSALARSRAWRDPLVPLGGEIARGNDVELPIIAIDTELGELSHRLELATPARRTLLALYCAYLVGEPALPIAVLARIAGDWTEPLGQGDLTALAMLDRQRGRVALRAGVTDLLDGAPPRDIRLAGGAAGTPRAGAFRAPRDGKSDATLEAELAEQLGRIAIVAGDPDHAILEARLHGATAIAFHPPEHRPHPWSRDAGLVLVLYGSATSWVADLPTL